LLIHDFSVSEKEKLIRQFVRLTDCDRCYWIDWFVSRTS